ncbi:hypothetical protein K435DRAFT_877287 [Dendrothele bispora CBS 962.96]|uniref:Uncharacterized protein n=1 Tax=Dendrothele bispora (strain CBS 962.96) TaxID=1314807 RepID=A0A4S8KQJ0_DENBC|nr:hypothetical protein K435DRAFT_877287 [Dendrothele bispora CBS 962.96]
MVPNSGQERPRLLCTSRTTSDPLSPTRLETLPDFNSDTSGRFFQSHYHRPTALKPSRSTSSSASELPTPFTTTPG